jgi:hypothetical protein
MSELTLDPPPRGRRTAGVLLALAGAWAALVTWAAADGWLQRVPMPWFAALVALGITAPVLLHAAWPAARVWVRSIGLLPIGLMHVWRVPAALLFFFYGAQGALPTLFWVLAGVGDLLAGVMAWGLLRRPDDPAAHWRFHSFGFADFVVAVGTGLAFTLMQDPRMQLLATLPMAWIPLFGVGLSGASHLVAFHLLWQSRQHDRLGTPD